MIITVTKEESGYKASLECSPEVIARTEREYFKAIGSCLKAAAELSELTGFDLSPSLRNLSSSFLGSIAADEIEFLVVKNKAF